ncbi:MAG TPA: DNA repair protein RadA [Chloroflexia bacterium]|nr:DNA repair protein RadA [Chloroflexia bacterium]
MSGDPGIGKCVAGSTRVLDPTTGDFLPIGAWQARLRPVVAINPATRDLAPAPASAFHARGTHPIVEVTTALGHTLRCTPDHPLLTPAGWQPVRAVRPGDRIAAPRALPYFGQEPLPDPTIRLLAAILGHDTPEHWPAATQAVPSCIFRLPRPQLALFLHTLLTRGGSVAVPTAEGAGISYATPSRQLAADVQHLLLRFGLVATCRRVNHPAATAYEVTVPGASHIQRFRVERGMRGRADRPVRPAAPRATGADDPRLCPSRDLVTLSAAQTDSTRVRDGFFTAFRMTIAAPPGGRADLVTALLDDPEAPVDGDVYWDTLAAIEPAGAAPVYDLTVPGPANFVANDLLVHNSTILLSVSAQLATGGRKVLYVSAEESIQQIKLRADRLGLDQRDLYLLGESDLDTVRTHVANMKPGLVVIDSIQTVFLPELTSTAGSVTQVRESTAALMKQAKSSHIPMFLVGHVTKDGNIAGPRVLEHMVDAVLYLEGDRFHQYRLLRSVKNRFGSTNEVGVFEMATEGLIEVPNPSAAFLAERSSGVPGSTVAVTMEGTRPLLVEVQALTTPSATGMPRRTANGIDNNRMHLLLAVLTKRMGLPLYNQDVYVNVVGGLKIDEPAVDLAVAVAIASSFKNVQVDPELAVIGEVGLSGELRSVGQLERRLNEAAKLGFRRAIYPKTGRTPRVDSGIQARAVAGLPDAIEAALTA